MPDSRLAALVAVPAAALAVLIAFVLTLIGAAWAVAVLVGIVVGATVGVAAYVVSGARVLSALATQPIEPGRDPRVDNMLDTLCVNNGFDRPDLLRVDSAARNSAVLASGGVVSIVVTDGLLRAVDHMGLEALFAHQLSVGAQGDLEFRTRLIGLLSLLPEGLARRVAAGRLVEPEVFSTDIEGARLTRYPPGQVTLLETLADGDNRVGGVSEIGAGLWLVNPLGGDIHTVLHPAVEDRIALLREL
ncbi:MAG: hypothetical protein OEW42_13480 [Acidimicrobiia bacterium]|nr:hypothetical protein [Acidimicrobiia bacterium]